jgi:hypothetical protein
VLVVAGKRISLVRLAAFCAAGGVAVLIIAFLDHLRPPAGQTHLGRFFGDLLHGSAGPVVERKFGAMLHTFGNMTLTPIVVAGLVLLFVLLRRPDRLRAGALDLAFAQAPLLRAGLMGALLTAIVGTLVNDSGVAVLALGLVVGVPIALAAGVRALENGQPVPAGGPPVPLPGDDAAAAAAVPAPRSGEAVDPGDHADHADHADPADRADPVNSVDPFNSVDSAAPTN